MAKPLQSRTKQCITCGELDALVKEVYGRIYDFQQQDDCKDRGTEYVTVPVENPQNYKNDTVPEEINGDAMGVSFAAWLTRGPKRWNGAKEDAPSIGLFWKRNFYPHVDMVLNDLHSRGLIEAGEYVIEIDW